MLFFKSAISLALAAFAAVASAQASTKGNAVTAPTAGTVIAAGDTFDIKWMNPVGQQVTLVVMDGAANSLKPVRTIIANLPNTGTYTWSVPEDLPSSGTYTIRISYDSNPTNYNYSDRFVFTSNFIATTSAATTSAPAATSTSAPATSAPSNTTASASETETGSSTIRTSTSTRRTSTSESTGEPTSAGAPQNAGTSTLSSPLAVIVAVIAAALFIH